MEFLPGDQKWASGRGQFGSMTCRSSHDKLPRGGFSRKALLGLTKNKSPLTPFPPAAIHETNICWDLALRLGFTGWPESTVLQSSGCRDFVSTEYRPQFGRSRLVSIAHHPATRANWQPLFAQSVGSPIVRRAHTPERVAPSGPLQRTHPALPSSPPAPWSQTSM